MPRHERNAISRRDTSSEQIRNVTSESTEAGVHMWRVGVVLAIGIAAAPAPKTIKDLTFLTRDGCVNTPDMVNNLDDALKALGWPNDYQFMYIGKLPSGDVRTGYPTPTLLWKGKDIFGMPAPKPPFDVPS
jgi:hypothetical protein